MNKGTIDFQQFSLAPRRKPATQGSSDALPDASDSADNALGRGIRQEPRKSETLLPRHAEEERRRRSAKKACEQQDTRRRLKSLKRSKDRTIKFYVNVPLEQAMKERLMRAAHENDVKMTVIMQAAIDTYLEDNGY